MPSRQKLLDTCMNGLRTAAKWVIRGPVGRVARIAPRTVGFVRSHELAPGLAAPQMTNGLLGGFLLDEVVMSAFLGKRHFPQDDDASRVALELRAAEEMYGGHGWLADPESYHRSPPALGNRDLVIKTGFTRGLSYRHLSWESGFEPRDGEPGRDRWLAYTANRRAAADVLVHPGQEDRPWVVCVHGYTMGYPSMDFHGLHAKVLHHELGFNLAMPVLPLHGPRKATRISGEAFLSFDLMNSIHGFTQAMWDIRRLVSWIRAQGGKQIGLYGVSLGGYTVALLSELEPGLEAVVSGIPVADVRPIMIGHSPPHVRRWVQDHGVELLDAHRVVSPLALDPKVDHERRFIFAGYGDRISSAGQAHMLWSHWQEPEICWYPSGHLGYLWSPAVMRFLKQSLRRSLLASATPAEHETEAVLQSA
jgi:hypothetical protein